MRTGSAGTIQAVAEWMADGASPRVGVGVCEPARCAQWVWCRWSELAEPLFAPLASLRRSGFVPDNAC